MSIKPVQPVHGDLAVKSEEKSIFHGGTEFPVRSDMDDIELLFLEFLLQVGDEEIRVEQWSPAVKAMDGFDLIREKHWDKQAHMQQTKAVSGGGKVDNKQGKGGGKGFFPREGASLFFLEDIYNYVILLYLLHLNETGFAASPSLGRGEYRGSSMGL